MPQFDAVQGIPQVIAAAGIVCDTATPPQPIDHVCNRPCDINLDPKYTRSPPDCDRTKRNLIKRDNLDTGHPHSHQVDQEFELRGH